jgi:hypothetical protein
LPQACWRGWRQEEEEEEEEEKKQKKKHPRRGRSVGGTVLDVGSLAQATEGRVSMASSSALTWRAFSYRVSWLHLCSYEVE